MATIEIPTPYAPFRWESPTGAIHAGALLEMDTYCGRHIGRAADGTHKPVAESGWRAVEHETMLTCVHCRKRGVRAILRELDRRAPQATKGQLELFDDAIRVYAKSEATITAKMDEDGTMLLIVVEDGFTTIGRFGKSGRLLGDWF